MTRNSWRTVKKRRTEKSQEEYRINANNEANLITYSSGIIGNRKTVSVEYNSKQRFRHVYREKMAAASDRPLMSSLSLSKEAQPAGGIIFFFLIHAIRKINHYVAVLFFFVWDV